MQLPLTAIGLVEPGRPWADSGGRAVSFGAGRCEGAGNLWARTWSCSAIRRIASGVGPIRARRSPSRSGQKKTTKAGADGSWHVMLDAMPAGGPHTLSIQGKNTIKFDDVLVGEVWICSGQSNMQWSIASTNDGDLEIAAAKYPNIRLITVPNVGTQEPQQDFKGEWQPCRPDTVGRVFGGRLLFRAPAAPDVESAGRSDQRLLGRLGVRGLDPPRRAGRRRKVRSPAQALGATRERLARAKAEYESKRTEWQAAADKAKAEDKQPPPSSIETPKT